MTPILALLITGSFLAGAFTLPTLVGATPGSPCQESADCREEVRRIVWPAEEGDEKDVPVPAWAWPDVPEAIWRLVEAAQAEPDEKDRHRCLLDAAEDLARATLEEPHPGIQDRFALAVVLGVRADTEEGRARVIAAAAFHEELRVLLEADPEHARARHMLGRLHAGVLRMNRVTRWVATTLLGGGALREATWEEAERNLSFAERASPEVPDHHLQLANLYRDTDRPDLAVEELRHVLALPAVTPMELATRAEAEATLRDLLRRLDRSR